jgi:hypothetical protein
MDGAGFAEQSRDEPQRRRALRLANRIRSERARLKRRLAAGELGAAQVIECSPSEARSMALAELLASQRQWGSERSRRLLQRVGVHEQRRLGQLTERQRRLLITALNEPRR